MDQIMADGSKKDFERDKKEVAVKIKKKKYKTRLNYEFEDENSIHD